MKNIYLGWIAYNNDPYQWVPDRSNWNSPDRRFVLDEQGRPKTGPTLSFFKESEYAGKIEKALLLAQPDDHSEEIVSLLKAELPDQDIERVQTEIHSIIDHNELLDVMRKFVSGVVGRYKEERVRFLVNISPGPPAAQVIWMILTQAGKGLFDPHEVRVYQGVPPAHRKKGQVLQEIDLKLPSLWNLACEPFRKDRRKRTPSGRATQDPLGDVKSEAMGRAVEKMKKAAGLDFPVVLLGERGVGKTTQALRCIHQWSRRREGDFEEVVCGAYTNESLLKGELFGWKRGAFSDATKDYDGALKRAHNGTLFLDEIGDMSKAVQRTLIRAVESRSFLPLGAQKHETADFRLVCATNRKMEDLRGILDADFRDRVFRIVIEIPPLRQRHKDLPHIWKKVFDTMAEESSLLVEVDAKLHKQVVERLSQLSLLGNFRDLERLAMLVIMESFQGGSATCRVEWEVAEKQLNLLATEEARSEDALRRQTYQMVRTFYEAGPDTWQHMGGLFGDGVQRYALEAFEEMFKKQKGRSPYKKEIKEILGISEHRQDKLKGEE